MASSRKSTQSDAKAAKKSCKRESEMLGENVLLNYTYYLDNSHNRKVVLGFDTYTFEAKIIFSLDRQTPVSADHTAWTTAYNRLKILKDENGEDLPCNQLGLKRKFQIPIGNAKIGLGFLDLLSMFEMMDFFNIVMHHNNNASESVKEYYKQYTDKCRQKNVMKLPNDDFFIPLRTSYVHINYSRLFYEIPMFCSTSILFQIAIPE